MAAKGAAVATQHSGIMTAVAMLNERATRERKANILAVIVAKRLLVGINFRNTEMG